MQAKLGIETACSSYDNHEKIYPINSFASMQKVGVPAKYRQLVASRQYDVM